MRVLKTYVYPYTCEKERLAILKFLECLYGYLYCSGYGNILQDKHQKTIITNLLLREDTIS